jgi:hypothetical protein
MVDDSAVIDAVTAGFVDDQRDADDVISGHVFEFPTSGS